MEVPLPTLSADLAKRNVSFIDLQELRDNDTNPNAQRFLRLWNDPSITLSECTSAEVLPAADGLISMVRPDVLANSPISVFVDAEKKTNPFWITTMTAVAKDWIRDLEGGDRLISYYDGLNLRFKKALANNRTALETLGFKSIESPDYKRVKAKADLARNIVEAGDNSLTKRYLELALHSLIIHPDTVRDILNRNMDAERSYDREFGGLTLEQMAFIETLQWTDFSNLSLWDPERAFSTVFNWISIVNFGMQRYDRSDPSDREMVQYLDRFHRPIFTEQTPPPPGPDRRTMEHRAYIELRRDIKRA